MEAPIRTRHGLTRCTACRAHIRSSDRPSTTECPFCGAIVSVGRPRIALPSGRGGVLAASLLALGACGGPSGPPPAEPSHAETESSASDEDSDNDNDNENDEGEDVDDGEEPILVEDERPEEPIQAPVPAYGIAPPPNRYRTTPEQPPDEPMYGIAP